MKNSVLPDYGKTIILNTCMSVKEKIRVLCFVTFRSMTACNKMVVPSYYNGAKTFLLTREVAAIPTP